MKEELYNGLIERRSIRKYKPDLPPKEMIEKIAEAGKYAASGKNLQTPIIIAVTNKELRDKLSRQNAAVLGTDSDPFYGAPAVLVVLAKKKAPNRVYDGSLVMANLMLAAHALGLGSCWINRAREVYETDEGKQLLKSLGIEDEYEGIGNCIIGYPDCDLPAPAPRKKNWVYYID